MIRWITRAMPRRARSKRPVPARRVRLALEWLEAREVPALTIQLDYFPAGGSPQPTEMYVDYMRIYR